MNRAFADDGLYHFTSVSMADRTRHGSSSSLEADDLRISSVIVDEHKGDNNSVHHFNVPSLVHIQFICSSYATKNIEPHPSPITNFLSEVGM